MVIPVATSSTWAQAEQSRPTQCGREGPAWSTKIRLYARKQAMLQLRAMTMTPVTLSKWKDKPHVASILYGTNYKRFTVRRGSSARQWGI